MENKQADYSGWRTYETWNVAMWIEDNPELSNEVNNIIRRYGAREAASMIKSVIEEMNPLRNQPTSMFSDILENAMHSVDYREIAETFAQDLGDDEEETNEEE
jgi:hypothetical protein